MEQSTKPIVDNEFSMMAFLFVMAVAVVLLRVTNPIGCWHEDSLLHLLQNYSKDTDQIPESIEKTSTRTTTTTLYR